MVGDEVLLQRREEPLSANLDGETVMLDPAEGAYFSLGPVGSRVWALLEDPRSVSEVCRLLLDEFDIDRQTCRQEVQAFVDQLLDANLIEKLYT
jgi:hypothetical protein